MKYFTGEAPRFRYYRPEMAERLRFAMCFWHTLRGNGADPFGEPTRLYAWKSAREAMDAAFELMGVLGIRYWTFHDRDIAPEGVALAEMVEYAEQKQRETGVKLLWGTANLFSHPRYMSGAATSPDPRVFAHAGAQTKLAMEATHRLGGAGYVFWGGREGYDTLLNTDMRREREQYARFLMMAVEHAKAIGFLGAGGQLYIEPKPKEPTTHQYDSDAEACLNFLREFGLLQHFKLNIETNHATLAGHHVVHELQVARNAGALGSIDANVGNDLLGWDTDQFVTDPRLTTAIMLEVLRMGGFTTGGLNFDAKVRRESVDAMDLVHAHAGSMDAFALGLLAAEAILADGRLDRFVAERYEAWDGEEGRRLTAKGATLEDCMQIANKGEPALRSGGQERMENVFLDVILDVAAKARIA